MDGYMLAPISLSMRFGLPESESESWSMTGKIVPIRRTFSLLMLGWLAVAAPAAIAQATPAAKAPAFEAVSIKPNDSGSQGGAWGVGQNKYSAKNTPLARIILQAYLGQMAASQDRLKDAPPWVFTDPYDINAKADDATADSWKGLTQAKQVALAAPMLRTMLEDRCKLVAHTVPTEIDGYALVIGKHGSKLKESQPGEPIPERVAKFGEGWMMVPVMPGPDAKQSVTYLQITMAQFTAFISMGAKPILDQTGLAGKYDFEVPFAFDPNPPEAAEGAAPPPRPDAAHLYNWGAIGLELKPIKVPAQDVVIDHIERPSAN
jgi:uncharacterized protein (TIGR03435 family)